MAAPDGKYFIQDQLSTPAPHHESFQQLWETKWKQLCSMGVYPFMFGAIQDFEPVVQKLIDDGYKDPYNWDNYAGKFISRAEEVGLRAWKAESNGKKDEAAELYLYISRVSALYRIARFPIPRSGKQRYAWIEGKRACLKGLSMQQYPVTEITIRHTHATGTEMGSFPVYAHIPAKATTSSRAPCIVIMTGLDGYRTELAVWSAGFAALGVATLIFEIPGTGDSPANPSDIASNDRILDSILDYIGSSPIDPSQLILWGFSTGGYHAIRAAHTHATRFKGFVALGGGCHYMFDPAWLDAAQHLEYPFDLGSCLAQKFGYGNDFERFKAEARQKFSLLEDGTLDKPCGRLLLVNGTGDEIFPIDDYYLALCHGGPKEVRFVQGRKHMGEPESFGIVLQWIYDLLGIDAVPAEQLKTIPFKAKYP
ncbi:hypothetical protein ANO11243_004120 [Dothideomycetidae sp. 11243]|nr:hypothetical protein ANO11243_004120 [fungal sp. No.11243]